MVEKDMNLVSGAKIELYDLSRTCGSISQNPQSQFFNRQNLPKSCPTPTLADIPEKRVKMCFNFLITEIGLFHISTSWNGIFNDTRLRFGIASVSE